MQNLYAGGMVLAGFVLLIVGAEWLVRGAASLAKRMKVTELVIGLTVVAMGTSMPELIVNIFASAQGRNDIVFGNILGSNLFNTLCILGVSGLIYPLTVQRNTTWKEIPFSLLVTLVLFLLVNDQMNPVGQPDRLSRNDSLVLLLLFAIFLVYAYGISKASGESLTQDVTVKLYSTGASLALLIGGLAGLVVGGKFCVDGSVTLARQFGLSEKFIACTVIATGTSLPELATSAVAAYRRRCDIAVGNIVGSNIFNILLILGVSGTIRPAPYNPLFNGDAYILIAGTTLLFAFMFLGKRHTLGRVQAAILLAGYVGYVCWLLYWR